jgi:hypothetical protein
MAGVLQLCGRLGSRRARRRLRGVHVAWLTTQGCLPTDFALVVGWGCVRLWGDSGEKAPSGFYADVLSRDSGRRWMTRVSRASADVARSEQLLVSPRGGAANWTHGLLFTR